MRRAGFSLIEALIALAIASVSLLAIFDLQHQMSVAQQRLDIALKRSDAQRNSIAAIEEVNPDATPQGEITLGQDTKVQWTSSPISVRRLSAGFPTGVGSYWVQLYRLSVHVVDAEGKPLADYQIDRVGWRGTFSQQTPVPY